MLDALAQLALAGPHPCESGNPDDFFPKGTRKGDNLKAQSLCWSCPSQGHCLDYAMQHPELEGIWGGFSEYERKRLRRKGLKRASFLNLPSQRIAQ